MEISRSVERRTERPQLSERVGFTRLDVIHREPDGVYVAIDTNICYNTEYQSSY